MDKTDLITYLDLLILPFYLILIFFIAGQIRKRYIRENPIYKYFILGLFVKIVGAISLCLIYVYYYKEGGDTLNYHHSGRVMVDLFFEDKSAFFNVWLLEKSDEGYSFFNQNTGYPIYWNDRYAWNVVRLITPVEFLGLKRFLIVATLMACISFSGVWKLYMLFCKLYPALYKNFAIAILFFPSVVFWGSGILKDSLTLAAACWFCYSFYYLIISKKKLFQNASYLLISSFVLITIKPYIFVALLPGCMLWAAWNNLARIKNLAVKIFFIPIVVIVGVSCGLMIWSAISAELGQFSNLDSMIMKAHESYEDLKQEYYQGNSFDLGKYDPTIAGILSKFPIAVVTGLFRPFLWEAKNAVMIFSGIENLLIIIFTIYVFGRKPLKAISKLFREPIILFCLIFAICFAFSIAISTSNFGALVRLRIPLMPFFMSGIIILNHLMNVQAKDERK